LPLRSLSICSYFRSFLPRRFLDRRRRRGLRLLVAPLLPVLPSLLVLLLLLILLFLSPGAGLSGLPLSLTTGFQELLLALVLLLERPLLSLALGRALPGPPLSLLVPLFHLPKTIALRFLARLEPLLLGLVALIELGLGGRRPGIRRPLPSRLLLRLLIIGLQLNFPERPERYVSKWHIYTSPLKKDFAKDTR